MLAYQHAYHAGNFADVHKHLTLYTLIQRLLRKESSITYIDTHAGRGRYPLAAGETHKLQEYREGVAPLWRRRERLGGDDGSPLSGWLAALAEAQATDDGGLTHYPGSPWWLAHRLRPQDRLSLFELHPGEHEHLSNQALPANARRVHGDGLAGLRRLLPVKTPRLCVLIDPSYERKDEYAEVAETLIEVARKVRHAMVVVWYPLLPAGRHRGLLETLRDSGLRKLWRSELVLRSPGEGSHGMYGSGLLVLNPPWGLDQAMATALDEIAPLLASTARHDGDWWVPE